MGVRYPSRVAKRHGQSAKPRFASPIDPLAAPAQPALTPPGMVGVGPGRQPENDKAKLLPLIEAVEKARHSRVLVYWTSDMAKISEAVVLPLYDQLVAIGPVPRLDLVLVTRGGDTEAPWRIVSLIREFCSEFGVLVPYRASSAGTLISLGADEIVMTALGTLGPIDPSRTHPLLPRLDPETEPDPVSVQDMRHAMKFIRDTAGQGEEPAATTPYTPDAMAQIVTTLFDKVHPLVIGAIEQAYALSKLIATQCLRTHMSGAQDAPAIAAIVDRLCDDYKSHSYTISRKEAREIGLKVVDAPPPVDAALIELLKFFLARDMWVGGVPSAASRTATSHVAWLESTALNFRATVEYDVVKPGQLKVKSDQWAPY
jgi:serine dehydrogenase proteinase